ncbi:family 2 glycosyl transferase [Opitutaceae bacterium EW11]|nr:family 2 glycosyl transferase [Opitutaceae bacterium EW11]
MSAFLSVILPTHNPDRGRLARSLAGLRAQTLRASDWELIVVDNASEPSVEISPAELPPHARIVREPALGLTFARRAGFRAAAGEFFVLVDDDNVLASDYLESVLYAFVRLSKVGAIGGESLPEFEVAPPNWTRAFFPLLALRDLGGDERIFMPPTAPALLQNYPPCSPIGAGMGLRRAAITDWLDRSSDLSDRSGTELSSGGDNDIVLSVLESGWGVAYVPKLRLTHLIPAPRLEADYLARLNRGIQRSWMQVLTKHGINPWHPIEPWTVPLRKAKAWCAYGAWRAGAPRVRWAGACGHFEGRVRRRGEAASATPSVGTTAKKHS